MIEKGYRLYTKLRTSLVLQVLSRQRHQFYLYAEIFFLQLGFLDAGTSAREESGSVKRACRIGR
jgi:hypothetical protein